MTVACENYKFMRAFEPLLNRDLAVDAEYRKFQEAKDHKHWQDNMSTLKGMIDEKNDLLQKLKAIKPNPENQALYQTLVEDLNNSIAYLTSESEYFHKNTEYGMWLANAVTAEGLGSKTIKPSKEVLKAKEEVLRVQAAMTNAAEKCNASQERLARLLQEKNLQRNYQPLKYTKYHKEHINLPIR